MLDGELLHCCRFDFLPVLAQLTCFRRPNRETELGGVDHRVSHSTVDDVDPDGAETSDFNVTIDIVAKCGPVHEPDACHLPVGAFATDLDQARGRLESQLGYGLFHRQDTGFEKDRRHAHRIRARHRRILGRFEDHISHVGIGVIGREDDVGIVPDRSPRLEQDHLPDIVHVGFEIDALVEHRFAGNLSDASDDHFAAFSFRMTVNHGQDFIEAHRSGSMLYARFRLSRREPGCDYGNELKMHTLT
ncbi:hypothetical protein AA309_19775 [Microvirga vignae]|uniref:Uncharacterized protein n=1 Tax=Microvirga vignae TaxID=1225564 RepID=A0A0H1RFV9_9HYPH|nr:hypothetical protein AA309_19775 [Microvirga vignae]